MKKFSIFSFLLVCTLLFSNTPLVLAETSIQYRERHQINMMERNDASFGIIFNVFYDRRGSDRKVIGSNIRGYSSSANSFFQSWRLREEHCFVSLNVQRTGGYAHIVADLRLSDGTVEQVIHRFYFGRVSFDYMS